MRRSGFLIVALCTMACVNSPLYHPGPNTFASLEQPGDGYVSTSKGAAPTSIAGESATSMDLEAAYALGPVALFARFSEIRTPPGAPAPADETWVRQSQFEAGIGRLSGDWEGMRIQDLFVVGRSRSDAAMSSNPDDPPPFRAVGRYWRVYAQRSAISRGEYFEAGTSLRLSAVHADQYEQWSRQLGSSSYDVAVPSDGSLTGVFLEPGFMFRVGYKSVKIGPVVSAPYALKKTAFKTQPLSASISLSVNYTPRR